MQHLQQGNQIPCDQIYQNSCNKLMSRHTSRIKIINTLWSVQVRFCHQMNFRINDGAKINAQFSWIFQLPQSYTPTLFYSCSPLCTRIGITHLYLPITYNRPQLFS